MSSSTTQIATTMSSVSDVTIDRSTPFQRVAVSSFGAIVGACAAALLDAQYAIGQVTTSTPPALGQTWLTDLGLIVPVALPVGIATGITAWFWSPKKALSWQQISENLSGTTVERPLRQATAVLAPLASLGAILGTAHCAHDLLSQELPAKTVGAQLALTTLLIGATATAGVLSLRRPLAKVLSSMSIPERPMLFGGISTLVAIALFALGVVTGGPGGDGVLGILGVLTREGLNLRVPGYLLLIAASAYMAPSFLRSFFGPLAAALSLAPLVLTARSAKTLDNAADLATVIETNAPLGKVSLKSLRKATDSDKDGFARTFGGGDCNDHDPAINPSAIDTPGNGIDEDCSGADSKPISRPVVTAAASGSAGSIASAAAANSAGATNTAPGAVKVPEGLNVLLITVDTLRADLGYSGYSRPVSPNIDALAAKSTVFENAYSLASYTGKSVGPLMIGKYPSESHRGWSHFNSYTKEDTMVAERLQAAGISTLSVQGHWYFDKCCGLTRGFDIVDMSAFPGFGAQKDNDTSVTSEKLTDATIKRLSDEKFSNGRFFAWVHYLDPHDDYNRHSDVPDFGKAARDLYDNEVAFTDKHVGRLIDHVRSQPWGKKTVIMITSDHGEAFNEHKMWRHGYEVWEELVRVPLIVSIPGAEPKKIKARRSAIDVVPTILELMGVDTSKSSGPNDFISGFSLVPDVLSSTPPAERDLFVDMPAGPNNDERRAFYHGNHKLYISGGLRFQLFDLAQDPGETKDLVQDKELMAEMRARYDEFRSKLKEVKVKPLPKGEQN